MGFLTLGLDSFIACLAVGALVQRKAWLPFAALFGICDAGAFLLGHAMSWNMSESVADVVSSAALLALGLYLVVVAVVSQKVANTRWVWLLPVALTLDNITFGLIDRAWSTSVSVEAAEQLLSSALLGLVGIVLSAAIVRAFPRVHRNKILTAGIAGGAAMAAAPVLLVLA